MASSPIHLAITKQYLKNTDKQYSYNDIMAGTLYPDTIKDKNLTHFSDLDKRGKDIISHLAGKVNLYSFLSIHKSLTDFQMGWFIHLVTDYLFFDECFTKEYLLTHTYEEFRRDLYFSYDCLTNYLIEKYGITMDDYTCYQSEFFKGTGYQKCLFTKEMIDEFIRRVSSVDFDRYIDTIKLAKRNIKPYSF